MNVAPVHRCRLLIDPPGDGAWNMAVDDLLSSKLEEAPAGGCMLRFYQWSRPTLSLGYFQTIPDEYRARVERGELQLVRRASGGGAIVHDHELTYAFVVPFSHPLAADAETLYRRVHAALVTVLAGIQITACVSDQRDERAPVDQPFLCFERRAGGDVVVHGAKIAGSAQRRQRLGILQHGSILLGVSQHAPQLPGLAEVSKAVLSPDKLARDLQAELAKLLRLEFDTRPLSDAERAQAAQIVREKYGLERWTFAR
jgi:lipoate-protein ligase A